MNFEERGNELKGKPLLEKKNILMGCREQPREEVIKELGRMLEKSGYVEESYIEAMLMREKSFSTYMGNGLALPHGVEQAKSAIRATGLAVMLFPEGTDWDGNQVKVAVGIAAVGGGAFADPFIAGRGDAGGRGG